MRIIWLRRPPADLGPDEGARFARAAGALATWAAQRGAGMTVYPGDPVREGATFAIVFRLPAGFITAAGRVWLDLSAFSRPRHPLAVIGRPVSRLMRHRATAGYIAGLRTALS